MNWRCESCGAEVPAGTTSHGRAEHAPGCDGSCTNCPVEVECGPCGPELVEQVARRLFREAYYGWTTVDWDGVSQNRRDLWLRAARECIRLMEWARRDHAPGVAMHLVYNPLSLPPDDLRIE